MFTIRDLRLADYYKLDISLFDTAQALREEFTRLSSIYIDKQIKACKELISKEMW